MDATISFKPHDPLPLRTLEQPPRELLIQSLNRLVTLCPPEIAAKGQRQGFYQGPTSIAYLFFHLARSHPQLLIQDKTPAAWFESYLIPPPPPVESPEEKNNKDGATTQPPTGILSEPLCHHALLAAHTQDPTAFLTTLTSTPLSPNQDFLLGNAGLLSLLRFVTTFVPSSVPSLTSHISRVTSHIASAPWLYAGRDFTGAVHGTAGILAQLCLSGGSSLPVVHTQLSALLSRQLKDGNWYATADRKHEYMQWCHGAPGVLISLIAIEKFFTADEELSERIRKAIEKGGELVCEKGVITKEPCLCHGVLGNAFAVEGWGRRVHLVSFAEAMDGGEWVKSEDVGGLYCGEAGRAWVWAMMDGGREGFPCFTDV